MSIRPAILVLALAGWSVVATGREPGAGPEAPDEMLERVYPIDEFCLFVPPPAWLLAGEPVGVVELQALARDRRLALAAAERAAKHARPAMLLSAEAGLSPARLEQGGPLLRRMARDNARLFLEAWRVFTADPPMLAISDHAGLRLLDRLCPRRVVMVLTRAADAALRTRAYSLITGNLLAS